MHKDLSVGFLWREDEVGGRFCVSLARLLLVQNPVNHVLDVMSGPDLAKGRNALVEQFLKETTDSRLLMLDTDMVFDPKTVFALWQTQQRAGGVIGGLCVDSLGRSTMRVWGEGDFSFGFADPASIPPNQLVRVDGTGAAALLVPRSALEKMEYGTWFDPIEGFSEDLSFCLRLQEVNVQLAVHTGARFGHSKSHVLWPT